jgi:hypothetical protein
MKATLHAVPQCRGAIGICGTGGGQLEQLAVKRPWRDIGQLLGDVPQPAEVAVRASPVTTNT